MKAMILAAGRGERMGSLTIETPKPLIKVGGKCLIDYNIHRLIAAGINEIIINVCWLGDKIKAHLDNGDRFGVKITYLDEKNQMLGTGGGIANALDFFDEEPFWLVNADIYSNYQIPKNKYLEPNLFGHLVLVPNPKHNFSGDFFLEDGILSLKSGNRPFTYSGISLLSPRLFDNISEAVFPLEPLLEHAAQNGFLSAEFFDGFWTDVGSQERLNELKKMIHDYNNEK